MRRKSEFSSLSLICVVVLLAAATSSAQTAPSQSADPSSAQAATQSGAATIVRSRPAMAYSKAQRRENKLAARSQFLAQWKQRSATSARPSKKKASPAFGGTWQAGTNSAPDPLGFTGNPLLLTDGTVIVSDGGFVGNWYKLTPDITGSYVNGTWTQIATMPVINGVQYAPSDNASAVLPDGRVIVMGGEYNWQAINELPVDTNLGAIYDPVANTWTPVSAPAGSSWSNIGDAMSTVLADGTFLLGSCCSVPSVDALFDATNLTWTGTGAPVGGPDGQSEQGYTLLPNGNVLTVDIFDSGVGYNSSEQYDAGSGAWTSAGNTGTRLYDICGSIEIGPAPLRPDGTVVQFGGYACGFDDTYPSATPDPTGIYDSTTGTWSAGPDVPVVDGLFFSLPDAPAAVLPNGNILFAASPWAGYAHEPPTHFFEFTTANAINQVADAPYGVSEFEISGEFNFLVLPNGQILVDVGADPQLFYTPTGSPDPSWAPVISTSPSSVYPGTTYTITGTQLNGLTQGAYYGDDVQAATNYPIVQITNSATGHVFYGRTFNMSNRSVAPGVAVSTDFTVPANIELGASSLVVIANGIPSTPVPVGVGLPVDHGGQPNQRRNRHARLGHVLCSEHGGEPDRNGEPELCVLQLDGQRGQCQQRLDHGDHDRPAERDREFRSDDGERHGWHESGRAGIFRRRHELQQRPDVHVEHRRYPYHLDDDTAVPIHWHARDVRKLVRWWTHQPRGDGFGGHHQLHRELQHQLPVDHDSQSNQRRNRRASIGHLLCCEHNREPERNPEPQLCVLQLDGQRGQCQQRLHHGNHDRATERGCEFRTGYVKRLPDERKFRQRQTVPNEESSSNLDKPWLDENAGWRFVVPRRYWKSKRLHLRRILPHTRDCRETLHDRGGIQSLRRRIGISDAEHRDQRRRDSGPNYGHRGSEQEMR